VCSSAVLTQGAPNQDAWQEQQEALSSDYTFKIDQRSKLCPPSARSHIGKPVLQQFYRDCPLTLKLEPQPGFYEQGGTWDPQNTTLFRHYIGNNAFAIADIRGIPEIFAAEGKAAATSGGFIYTPEGIILIESFINEFMACQARALIHECYPDVPIRYVMLTSAHGDHAFGSYYWAAPDVTFVMHEHTRAYLQGADTLDSEMYFIESAMGPNSSTAIFNAIPQTSPAITAFNQDLTVTLGGDTVVAKYFGYGQTAGDFFMFHPKSRTMFGGNTINGPLPALPWLLDGHLIESLQALQRVRDFALEEGITQIVPGHGVPTEPNALLGYLSRYLEDLRMLVQRCVDKRLTIEETLAHVTLENYTHYSAWYPRHVMVNVPFAYVELGALAEPPLKLQSGEKCNAVCVHGGKLKRSDETSECEFCESGWCTAGNWWTPFWLPKPEEPYGVCV
jgi:glyoxylase-like metal-dependent hydrolase (beta-lactamase superfamily II)